MIHFRQTLAFDDVLLEPKYSDIETRSSLDLSSVLGDKKYSLPVISSPMDTVTGGHLALAMAQNGCLGVIHRYNSILEQAEQLAISKFSGACAIGATGDYFERAVHLALDGCKILCIDVAHGHHKAVQQAIKSIKKRLSNVHVMAGNVATLHAARELAYWDADSIRLGIGCGSICSTRINTGHGIPLLQTILDCMEIKKEFPNLQLIADGGIRNAGDIVKAFAAGADFVMLGSMLAGAEETPGEFESVLSDTGEYVTYKTYRGMASKEAQIAWRGKSFSTEGVSVKIPAKGPVSEILENIKANVASGLSYSGARNLRELRTKATFILQSHAGAIESTTHILNVGGTKK